jgi:hypothetical protein
MNMENLAKIECIDNYKKILNSKYTEVADALAIPEIYVENKSILIKMGNIEKREHELLVKNMNAF